MTEILVQNLLSPVVLFFVLGVFAAIVKSDLKIPSGLSEFLSIYLLIAIGLKGGMELSHYSLASVIKPILGALFLGSIIPVLVFFVLRWMKMDVKNAIGLAATYGSVSIVTYGAGIAFLENIGASYEGFMNVLVVLMESPAILVSLLMLNILEKGKETLQFSQKLGIRAGGGTASDKSWIDPEIIKESLFGKSILLLMGSLLIGLIVGEEGKGVVKPLFIDLYGSVLMLFLLNMGLVAGKRLPEVKKQGLKIVVFGIVVPIFCGMLGVVVGSVVGLSLGGTVLMGILAGSASYIAAPAALRTSVPEANPSIYLGLALGITFPFNLIAGIPLYYSMAQLVH